VLFVHYVYTHAHAIYRNLAGRGISSSSYSRKIRTESEAVSNNANLIDQSFSASDPYTEFGWRYNFRRPANTVFTEHVINEKLYMSDFLFYFLPFRSAWQVCKTYCYYIIQVPLKPSGHYIVCTIRFNIHKFYVLPTQCICVLCMNPRTKSDYFPMQH
jgi:hypothetical protein